MESAAYRPPIGAHQITRRRGYVHHGLYAGDGRVIHYAGFKRFLRRGRWKKCRSKSSPAGAAGR
jgi:hypothetical protein